MHGGTPGPLFLLPNNQTLTRTSFTSALNKTFQVFNLDNHQSNTLSFIYGAATSAKRAGVSSS